MRKAWNQLASLRPNANDAWVADFILLRARLLEETSTYKEAISWLTHNGLSNDVQRAPLYYFLFGLGCWGAGESESSKRAFSDVEKISGSSDLRKAVSESSLSP
jgi:hypothetical protein